MAILMQVEILPSKNTLKKPAKFCFAGFFMNSNGGN